MQNKNIKMKPDKVLSMLGIAAKAGKIVSGEFATENAVKSAKAFLVVTAADASENTKKNNSDFLSKNEQKAHPRITDFTNHRLESQKVLLLHQPI